MRIVKEYPLLNDVFCSFPEDAPLVPLEFLLDAPLIAADLSTNLSLGLHLVEQDSWTQLAGKEVAQKLKQKEIKKQEHIYEFIMTEKHHCMTLLLMQKVTFSLADLVSVCKGDISV